MLLNNWSYFCVRAISVFVFLKEGGVHVVVMLHIPNFDAKGVNETELIQSPSSYVLKVWTPHHDATETGWAVTMIDSLSSISPFPWGCVNTKFLDTMYVDTYVR